MRSWPSSRPPSEVGIDIDRAAAIDVLEVRVVLSQTCLCNHLSDWCAFPDLQHNGSDNRQWDVPAAIPTLGARQSGPDASFGIVAVELDVTATQLKTWKLELDAGCWGLGGAGCGSNS